MGDHPTAAPAKALTAEEQQARTDLCFELDGAIKAGLRAGRVALWHTARAVSEFDEAAGWSALDYESLAHWLADPEVGMTKGWYYDLASTWREMERRGIEAPALEAIDLTKVRTVLPAVKTGKVAIEEALGDARALGVRDLRKKYNERQEQKDAKEREHTLREDEPPAPVNTGTDAPVRASDGAVVAPEPPAPAFAEPIVELPGDRAHNPDDGDSGHLPDVEGEAREVEPHVLTHLEAAIEIAKAALDMPQRLPGARQAVRGALENLLAAVEA